MLLDLSPEPLPLVQPGRHSRGASVVDGRASSRANGRHSAGAWSEDQDQVIADFVTNGAAARATDSGRDHADGADFEALADELLAQLSASVQRPALLHPDDFPGGKWGMASAGTAGVIVVLLIVYALLGAVINR